VARDEVLQLGEERGARASVEQLRASTSTFGYTRHSGVTRVHGQDSMIQWQYFPKSRRPTELALKVVAAFTSVADDIDSKKHHHESNHVLVRVAPALSAAGFTVEAGKKKADKISVPVLFGLNGKSEKSFDADAHHREGRFVVEVEAGRAVVNNQFLKDFFQACMMDEIEYLALAVRNIYAKNNKDFERVCVFFETLYASRRLEPPLKGILIVGY
jgi:hypothetical protein